MVLINYYSGSSYEHVVFVNQQKNVIKLEIEPLVVFNNDDIV